MDDAELGKRLAALELAVAHLTEAVEELAHGLPAGAPSLALVRSHVRDIRENFNQVAPARRGVGGAPA
ncbi:MAG TPA: hypothetical protein VMB72_03050 [Acidimicrobiales bacterium]|nr:hypothetical protein [Acidimicrobiales bacterium]